MAARLQVLDLRDVVDSSGDHPRDSRPSADDSNPRAYDRDDKQADPHVSRASPGTRPRAQLRRDRQKDGHPGFESADRKSTRLNSSHSQISYAVFCLKKKKKLYYTILFYKKKKKNNKKQ